MAPVAVILLHVGVTIVLAIVWVARASKDETPVWIEALGNLGARLKRLEECKEAENTANRVLVGQIERLVKERDALLFENKVVQSNRNALLAENRILLEQIDGLKVKNG